ncbi:hypothetical protein P4V86_03640 [Brevibacillus laterosporus]|nr:hypothetical protein [Brevibacillus laterosporus]MED2002451.1 hypothetical protein [Brevibacillus laterosporus]
MKFKDWFDDVVDVETPDENDRSHWIQNDERYLVKAVQEGEELKWV